jgi:hypothetical protein
MTCVAISCGVVGGVVGVRCGSGVGGVGDGWRMLGSGGGWWGKLGVGTGGLGGGWDDSVWMVSAWSDVKNVVGDEGQEVEQQ